MPEEQAFIRFSLPPAPLTNENLASIKAEFGGPLTVRHFELAILLMRDHLAGYGREGAELFADDLEDLAARMRSGIDKSAVQLILEG